MIQGDRARRLDRDDPADLAVEMRARRKQMFEERAQKAPIKILFPLVFLIFPAMFLIVLGPALFKITESLP